VFAEVTATKTKAVQVAHFLKYNYTAFSLDSGELKGASKDEIISKCQISRRELDELLDKESVRLQILKLEDGTFAHFAANDMWQCIDAMVIFLNADEERACGEVTAEGILEAQDGEIKTIYCSKPFIEFGLQAIGTEISGKKGSYRLDVAKIRKFVGVALLIVKEDYQLTEYLAAYAKALEMAIPLQLAQA